MREPVPRQPSGAPRRTTALVGILTVLCAVAAACGGTSDGADPTQAGEANGASGNPADAAPSGAFLSSRSGTGIVAAGGNPNRIHGPNPCDQSDAEPITVAYVGANLAELDAIGLEAIVVEEPVIIISAYVDEVNDNGGINGRCVELAVHLWSLVDPVGSFTQICTDMPPQNPVFFFSLRLYEVTTDCATIGAQIPTIGLYASTPASTFVRTETRLFTDDGSVERLLARSLEVTLASGVIDKNDRIGMLQGSGSSAGMGTMEPEQIIRNHGLDIVETADLPAEYGNLELLLSEKQVRLLETGLSASEQEEAQRNMASLPSSLAELFAQIEEFYTEAAARFQDAGVTAVAITADWTDVRRMMRAAERIDWVPTWIANDIQPATLAVADAPRRQAQNLVQVSARRAAGDEVPRLDQGCITLRNTNSQERPFAHRPHSDAWNLITSVCDYLDVSFSALTRVDGEITQDSFIQAMNDTDYETQHGGHITFTAANRSGAERFRVLQADPDCLLNSWGCMRSIADWTPRPTAESGAEASG